MVFGSRQGRAGGGRDDAQATFRSWVRDHATGLYALAYRLCGDRELAEELVQETYYQAWRSMDQLRDPDSARPWLMRILRHSYARWARRRRQAPAGDNAEAMQHAVSDDPDVAGSLADRDWLQQGLDELDDRYKVVFLMVFVGQMSCREVADELGLPLGTVLSRIHRARQQLRRSLGRLEQRRDGGSDSADGNHGSQLRLGGDA